jgi:putative membrane protein
VQSNAHAGSTQHENQFNAYSSMSLMLSLHIVFLLIWSATLMYFPQLLVREATVDDRDMRHNAIMMQRVLYAVVMTPSALLTVAAGGWLVFERSFSGGWLPVKLALVLLMVFFHAYCGKLMEEFRHASIRRHLWFFRLLPLLPAVLVVAVVTLVVAKPF